MKCENKLIFLPLVCIWFIIFFIGPLLLFLLVPNILTLIIFLILVIVGLFLFLFMLAGICGAKLDQELMDCEGGR